MLNSVRILNFDDSITRQKHLMDRFKPSVVDLTDLGPAARLYTNEETFARIRTALDPNLKNSITFLGSGDFHHVASILISQFDEDISVISFDRHPDWDMMPPKISCGAWVTKVLNKDNIKKLVLLGPSSEDISPNVVQTGSYDLLKSDRVEIYPYQHKPTKVFLRNIPKNISVTVKKGLFFNEIHWQELKDKNIAEFFLHLLHRLPTKKVYVTIDKDCLRRQYSLTNWEEGYLELEDLLLMVKFIKENCEIVGLDITGDYSEVRTEGFVRTAINDIGHPRNFSAKGRSQVEVDSVNESTNIKILDIVNQ
jgi:arginase family enzyme